MKTVLVLNTDQMGHGDKELGHKILRLFLQRVPGMFNEVSAIVFYNVGVKLVTKDSPVLAELKLLHEDGVDLLPCGTCLNHYDLESAIGAQSNMDEIMRELEQADKVITL